MNSLYKELSELLTRENNRNPRVIAYKLEQLPEQLVVKLFNKVLEHKVCVKKMFGCLDGTEEPKSGADSSG